MEKNETDTFYDDITQSGTDALEKEADKLASEALIPSKQWTKSGLSRRFSAQAVRAFAEELRISPAIPAGRIRYERKNYTLLKELVGANKVRKVFLSHA